ncbi:MAG: efflux RND transporter periplasmic adaptor subunit, partial [bacterium]
VGRMARLLIAIKDPLGPRSENGASEFPLLIEDYVRVEIEGGILGGIFVIPRSALREGDRVWIMDENDRLLVRKVQIPWREEGTVWVSEGIRESERIVTSSITTPLPGMVLRVSTEGPQKPTDESVIQDLQQEAGMVTREERQP